MWQYNNELYHYGVLGMRWRHHNTIGGLQRIASQQNKSKRKLDLVTRKSEQTNKNIDKLTNKLQKNGGYKTEIGYAMAKSNGQKLSRQLYKNKKLIKKIAKIKAKMEKNTQLMQSTINNLPKDQIKLGNNIISETLKNIK